MSDTAVQEPLTEQADGELDATDDSKPESKEKESTIREYVVFVEQAADVWRRLEAVNAGSPDAAVKALSGGVDQNKRYAVVAGRYWQVGKPKVKQITQTSIEFE